MRIFLLILVTVFLTGCFAGRIETGNVGVRTNFNKTIELEEVPPGIYFAVFTSVAEYVTKETELSLVNLKPKAKDNLTLEDLDISIFYTVNPSKVADMVVKYSGMSVGVEDSWSLQYPGYKLMERLSRGAVYDTVAQYESLTLHTKRSEIEQAIMHKVQEELDSSDPSVFNLTKVVIRDVRTDSALEQSIQAAVQMQKQVEAKKNEVQLALAEAERKEAEANGIATANKIISESLTPEYLQYKQIEAMQLFAGQGTHTVLMPNNVTPLLNVK